MASRSGWCCFFYTDNACKVFSLKKKKSILGEQETMGCSALNGTFLSYPLARLRNHHRRTERKSLRTKRSGCPQQNSVCWTYRTLLHMSSQQLHWMHRTCTRLRQPGSKYGWGMASLVSPLVRSYWQWMAVGGGGGRESQCSLGLWSLTGYPAITKWPQWV